MEMEKEEAKAEGIAIVALSKNRGTLLTLFLWLFPNWLSHEINRSSARGALGTGRHGDCNYKCRLLYS